MRRPLQIGLIAALVVLGVATAALWTRNQQTSTAYANLQAEQETSRQRYAQTLDAIAEIQDSLNAITPDETGRRLRPDNLVAEQKLSQPSREQALESIALLNASIQRTKERITELEARLKKSGVRIAGLQKMVANLKQSVTEKEEHIAMLTTRVDALQTQVTGLVTQVQENEVAIEDKRRELATVYVAVGTKKELADQGVIASTGGFLGLGKTVQPTGIVNPAAYTPLDTDHETVVPLTGTKAKLVSAQPPSSYQLAAVDGRLELRILDPREFRRVRQVVIVTAT